MTTRTAAVAEVAGVLVGFVAIGWWLRSLGFMEWQSSSLGGPFLSNALLFLGLPAAALVAGRRHPGSYGPADRRLRDHFRLGGIVGATLVPATMLFPVLGTLGLDPKSWPGASLLGAGFAVAGAVALWAVSGHPPLGARMASSRSSLVYLAVLAVGLVAAVSLRPSAPLVTRTIQVLLFVALLEELFFRGYVQGRLNDAFGRPFSLLGTSFGPGLILASLSFGLFHPLMSLAGGDWPWALWTGIVGCVLGLVREKSGAALAGAVAHGILLLPQALFTG